MTYFASNALPDHQHETNTSKTRTENTTTTDSAYEEETMLTANWALWTTNPVRWRRQSLRAGAEEISVQTSMNPVRLRDLHQCQSKRIKVAWKGKCEEKMC
jgi:hypothetical protein